MYTLVVNDSYHENSAVLIKDNKIISGLEEERTSRHRHAVGECANTCIKKLLEAEHITIEDIDEICIDIPEDWADLDNEEIAKLFLTQHLGKYYVSNIKKFPKVVFIGNLAHHDRHAYASYYASGFESACSICIDGCGDKNDSVTLSYIDKNGKMKIIKKFADTDSLGSLYSIASNIVTGYSSEGKFMGLASFGRVKDELPLYFTEDGECVNKIGELNNQLYPRKLKSMYYPFNITNHKYLDNLLYYSDFAAMIQECINVSLLNLAKYLKKLYPEEKNLILSGGVTLNCTANGILDQSNIFENIYCFPATNDAGVTWGSAYYYLKHIKNVEKIDRVDSAYFGPKYDIDFEIKNYGKQYYNVSPIAYKKIQNQEEIIDKIISDGVVAWFQDGSECGPRALGHRSLLGDPRYIENWHRISIVIKKREFYRPLAPIVLAEHYQEVFEDIHPNNLTQFMLKNVKIKPEWRSKIPAVCHVDYTARPQILYRETNPELYDLITLFYEKTGIPLLVNTSFNSPGDPIVETLNDAFAFLIYQISNVRGNDHKLSLIVNNKYLVSGI